MPRQNEIDLVLTPERLAVLDGLLAQLETATADLPTLSAADKASYVRPPDAAEGWMRGMLTRAEQNLARLPRDFAVETVQRDLALNETLAPRELRLGRIVDRLEGARFLARSDAFAELLSVRRTLQEAGLSGVDDDLSEGLQRFFRRGKKTASSAEPTPAAPTPSE